MEYTALIVLTTVNLAVSSWDYQFSCCPPCGDSVTIEGTRVDGVTLKWRSETCSGEAACPLFVYSGCWNVPTDYLEFLIPLRKQSSSNSHQVYSDYPATECALMTRTAQYNFIVFRNEMCYGTNDGRLFNAGPASAECNEQRVGTANTLDIYKFSDVVNEDLINGVFCLPFGSTELEGVERSCDMYNSSTLTFREFGELVSKSDKSVQTGRYWLSDERSEARCSNHSLAFIDIYNCDTYSNGSCTYYCKPSDSEVLQWMEWKEVCETVQCGRIRFRYRLSSNVQQVDIVNMASVADITTTIATSGSSSITADTASSTSSIASMTSSVSSTDGTSYSSDTSSSSTSTPGSTVVSTEGVTESQEQLLASVNDIADEWKNQNSVSAADAVSGMQMMAALNNEGLDTDEVLAAVTLLRVLADKLNVTDSADAERTLECLSDAVDSLLSDHTPWTETAIFTSILEPVEEIVGRGGAALDGNMIRRATHLNIATEKLDVSLYNTSGYKFEDGKATVSIPSAVLPDTDVVNLLTVTYHGVGEMLGVPDILEPTLQGGYEMGDVMLSFALDSVPHTARLTEPVEIYLPVNMSSTPRLDHSFAGGADLVLQASCVYWNSSQWMWMSNGCNSTVVADQVRCQCDHLTSFAVLLRYTEYGTDPSSPEGKALTIIGQIGHAVSILSLVITFCLFVYLDNLKTERKIIHMNLVVALALAQLTFIVGIDRTTPNALCTVTAVFLHLFYTATFTWMLCEGLHLYVKIVAVFNSERKANRVIYYIIGWGIPVLIVGISMAAVKLKGYGTTSFCWLSIHEGLIWAFAGPVCVAVLINLCIMAVVINIVIKSAKSMSMTATQQKSVALIKAGVRGVVILTPLLGTNWIFGLMVVNKDTLALEFCFVILNSFQGLFIFLFHCVGSTEVRSALQQKRDKSINSQASSGTVMGVKGLKKLTLLFSKPKVKADLTGAVMADLVQGDLGPNLGGLKHLASDTDSGCDVDADSGIVSNQSPCSQTSFPDFRHSSDSVHKARHTSSSTTTDLEESEDLNISVRASSTASSTSTRAKSSSSGNAWT